MGESRASLRVVYIATALSLAAFVGGFALAGSLTVNSSGTEAGGGNFETATSISWWSQSSVGLTAIPTSVPTGLSITPGSPTVLAATGQAYMIGTGTAGDLAHYFKMTEGSSATASAELEIVFSISTGATPTITTVTVYLETQSTTPTTAQTFTLYYDLGSPSGGSIVLNSVQQISQLCSSVGTCP